MRSGVIALAMLAGGCNALFGLDPTSLRDDAGGPDAEGAAPDAATGWNTPIQVGVASTAAVEDDPAMGPGGLELYWSASIGGVPKDVFRSTRMAVTEQFVAYETVIELNSAASDATVRISADGLTLYMSSDRTGAAVGDLEILAATRSGPSWTGLGELGPPYTSAGRDHGATPCLNSSHIFLASDREGGDHDIFDISDQGTVYAVATEADEISPFVTESCLALYFAADLGDGSRDIYVVTRDDIATDWGLPVRVDDLSSPQDDQDPWISADGTTALFASDRSGSWDIWTATR